MNSRIRGLLAAAVAFGGALAAALAVPRAAAQEMGGASGASGACATCHTGIEEMHPWAPVTCVQCHGGDAAAAK